MAEPASIGSLVSVAGTLAAVGGFLIKGDEFVSAEARRDLSAWLRGVRVGASDGKGGAAPNLAVPFAAAFDRMFGADPLSLRFIGRSLLLTVVVSVLFLAGYVAATPGFAASLAEDPYQRAALLRQFSVTVLLVLAAVDYLSLAWCREVLARMESGGVSSPRGMLKPLAADLGMKAAIFCAGMVGIYVLYAGELGAFRGDVRAALLALPETLWRAIRLENLSSVYVYSCLVSSVWLWAFLLSCAGLRAAHRLLAGAPAALKTLQYVLPIDETPVRAVGMLLFPVGTLLYAAWVLLVG